MHKKGQLSALGIGGIVVVIAIISAFVVFVPFDSLLTTDKSLSCDYGKVVQTTTNNPMFQGMNSLMSDLSAVGDFMGCAILAGEDNIKGEYVCVSNQVTVVCKARLFKVLFMGKLGYSVKEDKSYEEVVSDFKRDAQKLGYPKKDYYTDFSNNTQILCKIWCGDIFLNGYQSTDHQLLNITSCECGGKEIFINTNTLDIVSLEEYKERLKMGRIAGVVNLSANEEIIQNSEIDSICSNACQGTKIFESKGYPHTSYISCYCEKGSFYFDWESHNVLNVKDVKARNDYYNQNKIL